MSRIPEVRTFDLAGGTALALHLGHRRSQDLDFFRAEGFLPQALLSRIRVGGAAEVLQEASGTLTVRVAGALKSRGITGDPYHLLRSLTFFEDAEAEAMPEVIRPLAWDEVTARCRAEALRLSGRLP